MEIEFSDVMEKHKNSVLRIVLVGCVKTKHDYSCSAKNLYKSPLWNFRRAYVEQSGCPWYILSALYGLLTPDDEIEPYDLTLKNFSAPERQKWSERVLEKLREREPKLKEKTIEIHAAKEYIEDGLEKGLRESGATVLRPLQGLRFGYQLQWYKEKLGTDLL